MLIDGVVYLLFFFGAPFIEAFYNFEGLALVTRVYSLNLFINSFAMVHRVILTKELKFKKIALITFLSSIISAIPAIIMAYWGYGYWALVGQSLISAAVTSALIMYQSKWRPSLIFSKNSLAKLAPFGLKMLVVYLFHAIYNNVYSLLIGKKFPTPRNLVIAIEEGPLVVWDQLASVTSTREHFILFRRRSRTIHQYLNSPITSRFQ